MSKPITPLWKQLIGALAGAAVAFVMYQAYDFTATHIQAMVTPTMPLVAAVDSSVSSASVSSAASSNRVLYGPFGSLKGVKKFFGTVNASSSSPVSVASSSSEAPVVYPAPTSSSSASAVSSYRTRTIHVRMPPAATIATPPQEPPRPAIVTVPHSKGTLPKSGFGLDVIAVMTVGAIAGKKRAKIR